MPLPGPLARLRRRHILPASLPWMAGHALSRLPGFIASWRSDIVWIERTILPGLDEVIHLLGRPRVLDIDDAIWLEGSTGRATALLTRSVDTVIAGNEYLADWLSPYCANIHIVPTAVDCRRFRPLPAEPSQAKPRSEFVIGWTGTSGNFRYLTAIQQPLARVLRNRKGSSLLIVADRPPKLPALEGLPLRFVRWRPDIEAEILWEMDVGIMPLTDDEWSRGKCSFKMLQYMAAGLPCVVSPVGMNRNVLGYGDCGIAANSENDWIDALLSLSDDLALRRRLGVGGRHVVECYFDVPIIAGRLASVFRALRPDRRTV